MMTDALALSGMIQSLNALAQIGKALVGIHDANAIREKAVELNREIRSAQASALATQADQFTLLQRIGELEKQIAELEAWDAEKEKYMLYDLRKGLPSGEDGAFAYRLKGQTGPSEPVHLLCAHCFQDRHKSILQHQMLFPGMCDAYLCHRCGNILYKTGHPYPEHFGLKPKRSGR
jgi:hypothetical protein